MNIKIPFILLAIVCGLILHAAFARAQGSLTPPGPPAPTMKTLAQIEARTPVDATNTPGSFDVQFTITQPGSYYLTGNITGLSTKGGILIQTNDVTLDLNGFVMTGVGTNYAGIAVSPFGVQNVAIRNGTLRNCGAGVLALRGYCELAFVRVYGSASAGIYLGDHCTVKNCTISGNGGTGLTIGNGCVVTDCLVSSNATGISGGSDCTISETHVNYNLKDGVDLADKFNVSQCTADGNDGSGFILGNNGINNNCTVSGNGNTGIAVGNGCVVTDCQVSSNYNGITIFSDCSISGCQANDNLEDGIRISGNNSTVNNCTANNNNYVAFEFAGIQIWGNANRVDGNHCSNNAWGIWVGSDNVGNCITRNCALGNNYAAYGSFEDGGNVTTNRDYAPIQTPSTATSPWANF